MNTVLDKIILIISYLSLLHSVRFHNLLVQKVTYRVKTDKWLSGGWLIMWVLWRWYQLVVMRQKNCAFTRPFWHLLCHNMCSEKIWSIFQPSSGYGLNYLSWYLRLVFVCVWHTKISIPKGIWIFFWCRWIYWVHWTRQKSIHISWRQDIHSC